MQSVHKLLFSHDGSSTPKLTLPPLVVNNEPVIKSVSWLSWRSSSPPAFLEPPPQTIMGQHRNVIQFPRSHRLSLSSLSSISTESFSEDDQTWMDEMDAKNNETDEQCKQLNNKPSLLSINATLAGTNSNRNDELNTLQSNNITSASMIHVDSTDEQNRQHIDSIEPLSSSRSVHGKSDVRPLALQPPSASPSSISGSDSSSPVSTVPSSISNFWASPSSFQNEQRHDFLTKNAHIKRPRNAWIHFRCYFGQILKATDPTIRAEEISKRASEYWSRLTNKQKKPWHVMAEQEKLAHQEAFPDYRYRPKRALPKSVALTYPSPLACKLDQCSNSNGNVSSCNSISSSSSSSKKFRLA